MCIINIGLAIFNKQNSVPFWSDKSDYVFLQLEKLCQVEGVNETRCKIMIPFLSTELYNWTNTDGTKEDGPPMLEQHSAVLRMFLMF